MRVSPFTCTPNGIVHVINESVKPSQIGTTHPILPPDKVDDDKDASCFKQSFIWRAAMDSTSNETLKEGIAVMLRNLSSILKRYAFADC